MEHMLRTVEDYIEARKGVRVVINPPDTPERLAMLYTAYAIAVQWTGTSS
jgi:hypothetical protein